MFGIHVVDRFTSVLFKVDTLDPHQTRDARSHVDENLALAHDGFIKLR